jgi:hypothetical protein
MGGREFSSFSICVDLVCNSRCLVLQLAVCIVSRAVKSSFE